MHIAVNTRLLLTDRLDGIGWFTHEVMQRLVKEMPEARFTFLFDRPFDKRFIYGENVVGKRLFPPTRHPLLYELYFERVLPPVLKQLKPDLFFSPDGFLSLKSDIAQVPVIHDINFEHRPQDLPKAYSNYYRKFFPRFAKKASRIVTVSDYSALDISKTYGVERSSIDVAHNGYNTAYRPLGKADQTVVRSNLTGGVPYFIFVGNFSFRKNVHGIIKAYDLYRAQGGNNAIVLVGDPLWQYKEMEDALDASPNAADIIFPGRLRMEQLTRAMASAEALIFPSYFEGFGIPILEAFAAEIPVITSDLTSLPEVAGDAALYANPEDIQQISKHMLSIQQDENQRIQRIESGRKRLEQFSWDRCANKVKIALLNTMS